MLERDAGREMLEFMRELFPVCRSITGPGVRETLEKMRTEVPLNVVSVPTGTAVFDWTVPREWSISDAWIVGPDGDKVLDFRTNNLHVLNYSIPIDAELTLEELLPQIFTLPEKPDWVPYRTSYYNERWGFCMSENRKSALKPGNYRVRIDSSLKDGVLNYGELVVPGQKSDEVLIYSHICHPSIANDNLSGIAVTTWWARSLLSGPRPYFTYRFVWGPGTIGSITWLARNQHRLAEVKSVLIAVLLGRPGAFHYKRARNERAPINSVVESVLAERAEHCEIMPFSPYGYDERQFCSPGIDLAAGRLSRVPDGEYPEYHTSADNLESISSDSLLEALAVCQAIGARMDQNRTYVNRYPYGEPQLGKRGLYGKTGGNRPREIEFAMLWVLNYSDGDNDLLTIADRSGLPFASIHSAAALLSEHHILETVA